VNDSGVGPLHVDVHSRGDGQLQVVHRRNFLIILIGNGNGNWTKSF
jgi:hypothetical protein